jgi:hypothetical protein
VIHVYFLPVERCEMWCWRRMEKISRTDHVRNEVVLLRVKEQRNILHEISKRKANWIGHILPRNCLLQQIIEGKIRGGIEVTERRSRRRSKLLDDLKERRGYSHLKEEALDRTTWRACFGRRGFGFVVRQATEWMKSVQCSGYGLQAAWSSSPVEARQGLETYLFSERLESFLESIQAPFPCELWALSQEQKLLVPELHNAFGT